MGTQANRNFATLLDELIAARDELEPSGPAPTIPFDYLAVADELHSGRIRVAEDAVEAEYRDFFEEDAIKITPEPAVAELPIATDPQAIAAELGLDKANPAEFTRIRRRFAFANHPDRVAPHLREHAMLRMKVANVLIDEACKRAIRRSRR
jgi:hypothetical protein